MHTISITILVVSDFSRTSGLPVFQTNRIKHRLQRARRSQISGKFAIFCYVLMPDICTRLRWRAEAIWCACFINGIIAHRVIDIWKRTVTNNHWQTKEWDRKRSRHSLWEHHQRELLTSESVYAKGNYLHNKPSRAPIERLRYLWWGSLGVVRGDDERQSRCRQKSYAETSWDILIMIFDSRHSLAKIKKLQRKQGFRIAGGRARGAL